MKNKLTHTISALCLAGALTVGVAGAAGADTPGTATPAAKPALDCGKAQDRLAKVETRVTGAGDRIVKAQARHDQLVTEGKTERATVLADRIQLAKDRLVRVETRLDKVKAAVAKRCTPVPSTPAS
jgi:hypothetical protein